MKKKSKLFCGVGINDADYVVQINETTGYTESGKRIQKLVWICPFYSRWTSMLTRCYSEKHHKRCPTYIGCCVLPEWHYFMTFRGWMEKQDWEGKHLDKDILLSGNRIYGPDTCVFVDAKVNLFLLERQNHRGEWPIGVYFHKAHGKFQAKCKDVITGKRKYLGFYLTAEEAHRAWLTFKLEQARILADEQTDPRIAKALIQRYESYV